MKSGSLRKFQVEIRGSARKFRCLIYTTLLALLALPVHAQFIGYVSPQTVQQTLGTAVTCTGSAQTFAINNLGQTQHYLQVAGVTGASKLQAVIQGFDVQGNVYTISDALLNAVSGTGFSVKGSGYYPRLQASITCSPGTATFTLSYSGAWGTFDSNVGTYLSGQVEKLVFNNAAENSGQAAQFITPFGSTAGQIQFTYSNAGAGGTLSIACVGISTAPIIASFTLANSTAVQLFAIPNYQCPQVSISYSTNGVAGNVVLDYFFAQPGNAPVAYQYLHVTGTTAAVVKATAGFVHTLSINLGAAGTVSIFDLPSGSCTGTPATNQVAIITATVTTLQTFTYDVNTLQGICVKASVAMDLTVSAQ